MGQGRIVPVILAGGAGTRLWPASRDSLPKQFAALLGAHSTYQETLLRVRKPDIFTPPLIICHQDYRFFAQEQARAVAEEPLIILEPERRDSAAAIAVASLYGQQHHPEDMMLVLAADHVILDQDLFHAACMEARNGASQGRIVTFGIRPHEPKTSYGYIRPGETLNGDIRAVSAFVEKPDTSTAGAYVRDGYLWNSGNFMFSPRTMCSELDQFAPDVLCAARNALEKSVLDLGFLRLDAEAFSHSPIISIDYAVMEKTQAGAVLPVSYRWSDIGSWDAVWEMLPHDGAGNASFGNVVLQASHNCLVRSEGLLTTVLGCENMMIVATSDAVLVAERTHAEGVKSLVAELKSKKISQAHQHIRCYRPWGFYDTIDAGQRFQVKRITVLPDQQLSLQKHLHRSEHWVIVKGTAEITIDNRIFIKNENESAYIPAGCVHRLKNPGRINLEMIEVQTGSYLGEDDIIRLEDMYSRA